MLRCIGMLLVTHRMTFSMLLISAWLVLLFSGWAFGGLVYLLLIPAAWLFPWKDLRASEDNYDADR